MTAPTFTPEGKRLIYSVSTGAALARWPVDARLMLASGEYTADPPDGSEPAAPVDAACQQSVVAAPAQHALGIPLVVTRAHEAAPSQPLEDAVRTNRAGKRR